MIKVFKCHISSKELSYLWVWVERLFTSSHWLCLWIPSFQNSDSINAVNCESSFQPKHKKIKICAKNFTVIAKWSLQNDHAVIGPMSWKQRLPKTGQVCSITEDFLNCFTTYSLFWNVLFHVIFYQMFYYWTVMPCETK